MIGIEHPIFNLLKDSIEAYFVFEVASNTIIFQNKLAEDFFDGTNGKNAPIFDLLQRELRKTDTLHLKDLPLANKKGHTVFCDAMAHYYDLEQLRVCCKLTPKSNDAAMKKILEKEDIETIPLEALLRLTSDIIFHIDLNTKVLTHAGALVRQFGLPKTAENFPECISRSQVIHPQDLPGYMEFALQMSQGIGGEYVVRIRLIDGSFEWFQINSTPVTNREGKPIEILGKLQNIHSKKMAELEKQSAPSRRLEL